MITLNNNGVLVDEDGQHIAELCDNATQEQGESLVNAYNTIDSVRGTLNRLKKKIQTQAVRNISDRELIKELLVELDLT